MLLEIRLLDIKKLAALLPLLVFLAGSVASANSEILGTELTPVGADPKPSTDGQIPAWTGGLTTPPDGYVKGEPHIDPYVGEKPLLKISAQNVDQFRGSLTNTQLALISKFSDSYFLNVYKTHRSCAAPEFVYEATKRNVETATMVDDGNGFIGAYAGVPFPIPKSAKEIMWNYQTYYYGYRFSAKTTGGVMYDDGTFTRSQRNDIRYSLYNNPQASSTEDLDGAIFRWMSIYAAPARINGQAFTMTNTINQLKKPRYGSMYRPDTRRVMRFIPSATSYDAPSFEGQGMRYFDDKFLFNGSMDRYDWELIGKKEIYIPYNVYKAVDKSVELEELVTPGFLNPELIRHELHRVWVIEAKLKAEFNHVFHRRTFYIDEDSWIAVGADLYDKNDDLIQGQLGFIKNYYEIPTCTLEFDVMHDLVNGRYNIDNLKLEFGPANLDDANVKLNRFGPAALKRAVGR